MQDTIKEMREHIEYVRAQVLDRVDLVESLNKINAGVVALEWEVVA
jgi:hypothetical protein